MYVYFHCIIYKLLLFQIDLSLAHFHKQVVDVQKELLQDIQKDTFRDCEFSDATLESAVL